MASSLRLFPTMPQYETLEYYAPATEHPWLVKPSTSNLISCIGYINKKDSFEYGEFDSRMGFPCRKTP